MRAAILYILLLLLPALGLAKELQISNFIVKEHLTKNGKLAIIAVDSADNADESIHGTYVFTINGFQQNLNFQEGVAVAGHALEGSTFVYFKHLNQAKSVGRLYFIYKKDKDLSPYKINGLLLLIIPALLLLLAYVFKRMLVMILILGAIYAYLSFSKGLGMTQILESAYQVIKNLI